MDKTRLKIAFIGDSLTEGIRGASYFAILRRNLPQHELFNYGKGGDTVISLYRRLQNTDMISPLDLGFLWVGVNDVFVKTSWMIPIMKRLRRQPWSRNLEEFRLYYGKTVELLLHNINFVYTIPPLFIGEDRDNPWNEELDILSQIIQEVSQSFSDVKFINLRETTQSRLSTGPSGLYVPKSFIRRILDAFIIKKPEEIEKKASEKGFSLTVDGVHLNSKGAGLVAENFMQKIREYSIHDSATR